MSESTVAFAQLEQLKLGIEEIISDEALLEKLRQNRPLNVKLGCDPSAPDLHLGHSVLLNKLKQFQDLGHNVQFLIGDFTAMIGDPTGKNATRKILTREEVLANAETYQQQVFKILDPDKTSLMYNSTWMQDVDAAKMIEIASTFTVARMLERDDFSKRYKSEQPISIHEFLYPLMQGYDSVAMKADVELGGTDQKFNLLVGRDLQRHYGQPAQVIMTLPIIEGLDGVQKMSKSLNNYIGLTDTANDMFGKFMSVSDELMWKYMRVLMVFTPEEIAQKQKAVEEGANPRDIKFDMAIELISRFHDRADAIAARDEFIRRFQQGMKPEDIPEFTVNCTEGDTIGVAHALKDIDLVSSTSDAFRQMKAGAVKIDGERVTEKNAQLMKGQAVTIQVGKRRWAKITVV